MWRRVVNWRFGLLIGLAVLEGATVFVPIVPLALVLAAVAAPDVLRGAARFLQALADGR